MANFLANYCSRRKIKQQIPWIKHLQKWITKFETQHVLNCYTIHIFLYYQMKVKSLLSESIHIYCWIFTSLFKHKWKRKNFLEYAVISPNGLQLRVDNHYFALSRILHILPSILPCPFILLCQRSCDVCAIELIASSKYESATAKPSKKRVKSKSAEEKQPKL